MIPAARDVAAHGRADDGHLPGPRDPRSRSTRTRRSNRLDGASSTTPTSSGRRSTASSRSSPAGQVAATPVLVIGTTDTLDQAMQLMVEHEASHLIVIERHARRPIGVVSTLDVARAIAGLI